MLPLGPHTNLVNKEGLGHRGLRPLPLPGPISLVCHRHMMTTPGAQIGESTDRHQAGRSTGTCRAGSGWCPPPMPGAGGRLLSPDQRGLCGLVRHRRSKEITVTLNKMTCRVVNSHLPSIAPIFNYAATSTPVVTTKENEVQRGDRAAGGHSAGGSLPTHRADPNRTGRSALGSPHGLTQSPPHLILLQLHSLSKPSVKRA